MKIFNPTSEDINIILQNYLMIIKQQVTKLLEKTGN
jgi:hypothetical protein